MKRFALILGASGEIGQAISRKLAEEGWSLYLHYHSVSSAPLAGELESLHAKQEFIPLQADFTDNRGADKLIAEVFDVSCIVVANGHSLVKLLADTDGEELDALWRVHVKNPLMVIRSLSRFFFRHEKSYIVFISSVWGETGAAMETAYSTVKGAQLAFVKAYAKEMASAGTRVNAVSPGFIDTKMNAAFTEEERDALLSEIPLGLGSAQNVADSVAFLTGGKADYMSGQVIRINGAWYT